MILARSPCLNINIITLFNWNLIFIKTILNLLHSHIAKKENETLRSYKVCPKLFKNK
jgi:hypothetical protein